MACRKTGRATGATMLLAIVLAGCAGSPDDREALTLIPAEDSTLSGYHAVTLHWHPDARVELLSANFRSGDEAGSLIAGQPPRCEAWHCEIVVCAECMKGADVELELHVRLDGIERVLKQKYSVNRQPVLELEVSQTAPGALVLDVGGSEDPEGRNLSFSWQHVGKRVEGPRLTTTIAQIKEDPPLLTVNDGVVQIDELVTISPGGTPVFHADHYRCTEMEIASTGPSLLNPEFQLGPDPAVSTQLAIIGPDNKNSRGFAFGFTFEVRGTIEPVEATFDEGQDIARSSGPGTDPRRESSKSDRRKEPNRSEYQGNPENKADDVAAAFPDPLPAAGQHPPMVADNYDHHPLFAHLWRNTASDVESVQVRKKGLYKRGDTLMMIWLDQPIIFIPKPNMTPANLGFVRRAYYRAWMSPDLASCEKFFIVRSEMDAAATVTVNELTMR